MHPFQVQLEAWDELEYICSPWWGMVPGTLLMLASAERAFREVVRLPKRRDEQLDHEFLVTCLLIFGGFLCVLAVPELRVPGFGLLTTVAGYWLGHRRGSERNADVIPRRRQGDRREDEEGK